MVVLIEAVWVLESAYRFVKPDIFSVLNTLVQYPGIVIEAIERVNQAILTYGEGHTDFADCLILAGALERHLTLHTFDRKLARLHGVKEVGLIVGQ
jgi:predicted nucleic-acid-binding protein